MDKSIYSCMSYATPFFLTRFAYKASQNENFQSRITFSLLSFSAAFLNEYLVQENLIPKQLQNPYSPSISALLFCSTIPPLYNTATGWNSSFKKNIITFTIIAVIPDMIFGDYSTDIIASTVIYKATSNLHIGINYQSLLLSLPFAENLLWQNNYISYAATANLLSYELGLYNVNIPITENYKNLGIATICSAAGTLFAHYEKDLKELVLPTDPFHNFYKITQKFSNHKNLDLIVKKDLTSNFVSNIGLGIFANYYLDQVQNLENHVVRIQQGNKALFSSFLGKAISFAGISLIYLIYNEVILYLDIVSQVSVTQKLGNDFMDYIFDNKKFLAMKGSNFTLLQYQSDIKDVIQKEHTMMNKIAFAIPQMWKLSNFQFSMLIKIFLVIGGDLLINIFKGKISSASQYANEKLLETQAKFSSVEENDIKNIDLILQYNALNSTKSALKEHLFDNYQYLTEKLIYDQGILKAEPIYDRAYLYSAYRYLVSYMVNRGEIQAGDLFRYVRILQEMNDVILFQSKHSLDYKQIIAANNRLHSIISDLETYAADNTLHNLEITVGNNKNLSIKGLDFKRGNHERSTHLKVEDLSLEPGKIYAITGGNGSGKSSFATLLYYAKYGILDSSFFDIQKGTISYPYGNFLTISQKDYCPLYSTLSEVISYPQNLTNENEYYSSGYHKKYLEFLKDMSFISISPSDVLYMMGQKKQNWCKHFSGGELKQLKLAKALVECPTVLVLDEFFSPLSPQTKEKMKETIKDSCLADSIILVVYHDFNHKQNCIDDPFFDHNLHFDGVIEQREMCEYATNSIAL